MPPKKRAAASKTASKTTAAPEPMDATVVERPAAEVGAASNNERVCYAIKTLVSEFRALFPETPVEYGDLNGRNVALSVTFDLTTVDNDEAILAARLLGLVDSDVRVASTTVEDTATMVEMLNDPRFYDIRDSFGLAEGWSVMAEEVDPTAPVLIGTPDADPLTDSLNDEDGSW
jgi:hypothetical protein